MKKKRKAFALIEVLVAILLATVCAFFLLDFENNLVKQHKTSLSAMQEEQLMQEALVKFYEALYQNQIAWLTIKDQKSHSIPLSLAEWRAEYLFSIKEEKKEVSQDQLFAYVTIQLFYNDKEKGKSASFHIFCKQEERPNVQVQAT